jgi:hypothetical protein
VQFLFLDETNIAALGIPHPFGPTHCRRNHQVENAFGDTCAPTDCESDEDEPLKVFNGSERLSFREETYYSDCGEDSDEPPKVFNASEQLSFRELTYETVHDESMQAHDELSSQITMSSKSSWDVLDDIVLPSTESPSRQVSRSSKNSWSLVDIAVFEHSKQQSNEKCELLHTTIESEKQGSKLAELANLLWPIEEPIPSESPTWEMQYTRKRKQIKSAGVYLEGIMVTFEGADKIEKLTKLVSPNSAVPVIEGACSPDTGGTGACMGKGADTGGDPISRRTSLGSNADSVDICSR